MYRLKECPGSLALSNWVKRNGYFVPRNPWALGGTRIHEWLAIQAMQVDPTKRMETLEAELGADGLEVARKCAEVRQAIVTEWIAEGRLNPPADYGPMLLERRFWYRAGEVQRFSGQPDFILMDQTGPRGLIVNYKTGRIEAEPAADNMQLRTEVVLVKAAAPELEQIDAAIDEPLVDWESERVRYSGTSFRQAEEEILAIVDEATWHPERRVAGPWCVNCPARVYCREAQDYVQSALAIRYGLDVRELPRGQAGVLLWEKIGLAIKLFKAIKDNYEVILRQEPDALPGYKLPEQGHERRTVVSAAALKRALAAYLSADEVDACANYHLGKVEEKFGKKAGLKGVECERRFADLVADVLAITHDKPFIRELTKKERQTKALKS